MAGKQDSLIGRMFRHFKGNLYRLEGFAKDSETLEEMVVYRALYGDGGLWGNQQGQVCIASRGKVKKLCMEVNAGVSADVSIRALRGSGGLESP